METQPTTQDVEPSGNIQFVTEEQIAASVTETPTEAVPEENIAPPTEQPEEVVLQESQPEETPESPMESLVAKENYSSEEVESAVLEFLSEKLGNEFSTFDGLGYKQPETKIDERVLSIAKFVEETGRPPQDWFIYQSLDSSEMDDMTAVQVKMTSDYPNLSQDEISTLIESKYKLDPDLHDEGEVKVSVLQLKMDAQEARGGINSMREAYAMPQEEERGRSIDSPVNDQWVSDMKKELNGLESIEFDLGDGKKFNFGINEDYRGKLEEKNTRLDEYFDPYVRGDGSWDFDSLNTHRAVIDNVSDIVKSVYKQGLADGQKDVVKRAANITPQSPNQAQAPTQGNSVADQVRQALQKNTSWTF
jgi:hypothetical protein